MADAVTREEFASGLSDALVIIEKLAPYCASFDEMVGLIRPAVGDGETKGNGAQLKVLMGLVFGPAEKRR